MDVKNMHHDGINREMLLNERTRVRKCMLLTSITIPPKRRTCVASPENAMKDGPGAELNSTLDFYYE